MDALSELLGPAKIGRASRTPAQLWQVPAFLIGLVSFALVAATAPLRLDHASRRFDDDCVQLRLAYVHKNEKPTDYLELAQSVVERAGMYPSKAGAAHFLAGSIYQRAAEEGPKEQAQANRRHASTLLEKAESLGVCEDDAFPLLYRLGALLFQEGTDLPRALDYLSRSVERGTDQPAAGYRMLVEGNLRLPNPNVDAALEFSQKQLVCTETDPELWACYLLRGELLVRKGSRLAALQELDHIAGAAAKDIRIPARLLQTSCCEAERLWAKAIPFWKDLLKDADEVPLGRAGVLYHLGLCYQRADNDGETQAQKMWTEAADLGGAAGQAAGLRLGELHLTCEHPDAAKGVAEWTQALARVRTVADYKNDYLPLIELRAVFETVWQEYQGKRDYRRAEQLARLHKKLAEGGKADERLAQSLEGRARELLERNGNKAADESRLLFTEAGAAFDRAARVRPEAEQPPLLARSAGCYMEAHDAAQAVEVLQRFVRITNTEAALAEGWLRLADALLAVGQKEAARNALEKCIEYPTPFAYRARYQFALDAIEANQFDQAELVLKQNLAATGPVIDHQAHALSLYKLAALLFQRQNYDQATVFLKEAIRQYSQDSQSFAARDQLAFCYRAQAKSIGDKLKERAGDEAKAHLRRSMQASLKEAQDTYQELADDLQNIAARRPLSAEQSLIMTRAAFAVADLLADKDEFREALRRYETLLDKHRGQWEGLRACLGVWQCAYGLRCYGSEQARTLAVEAMRRTLTKTLLDVNAMPADHDAFRGPNRLSKERWLDLLRKESTNLGISASPANPQ